MVVLKKKIGQWKTIFSQWKTLIKIRLIFYRLFSKKIFFGKQSLSHTVHNSYTSSDLEKNIFFCSFSLSHNKLSHFFSSFYFFSLLTPSLSPPLTSSLPTDFSLYLHFFSFFSLFVLPSITPFFNKVCIFFLLIDRSTIFNNFWYIYQTICTGLVC